MCTIYLARPVANPEEVGGAVVECGRFRRGGGRERECARGLFVVERQAIVAAH
jgi:hypothetical protein